MILQVCAVDFTARRFLLPLMQAQREASFDVKLACAPGDYAQELADAGFPIYAIPFRRNTNVFAHIAAYRKLAALIRRLRPDIVHCHTPVASLIARPAARRAGVPLVIYTAHGFYFHDAMAPWKRRLHIALERAAQSRWADYLFTQSAEDLETALAEKIAQPGLAEAIGNGVDLELFDRGRFQRAELAALREEIGLARGAGPVVATIGRLVREKGHFELLEAFARVRPAHPGAQLIVVGDRLPSDRDRIAEQIRDRARALGLEGVVHFAGRREDVAEILAVSDVFCLASWREGLPRSIIEAMAIGLPVVATDIRGCREEVVAGKTGLLFPPRDAPALAEALGRLLGDARLRAEMGAAGRQRAEKHFSEAAVIAKQMKTLRRLMDERDMAWPRS